MKQYRRLLIIFVLSCDALIIHFALVSVGFTPPLSASLLSGMVSALAAAPIVPGALGQFDAGLISMLALFGIDRAYSSLATVLVRIVNLWSFVLISGLVTYIFGFSRALSLNDRHLTDQEASTGSPAPGLIES